MKDGGPETEPTSLGSTLDDGRSIERARPGDTLGERYLLLSELGRGAQGVVFKARDISADAIVALKLIDRGALAGSRLARARRELSNARRITHPNVLRIHDLVDLGFGYGLSMELVEGETLAQCLMREPRLSPEGLRTLARDLALSLSAAHSAGVIHRDLKPSNVILRAGTEHAVVADFGVSRLLLKDADQVVEDGTNDAPTITGEGALVGTPAYMSPEQLAGGTELGPEADIYAAGLILWEAATGSRLNQRARSLRGLREARNERAPRLSIARPDLPLSFCSLVERTLEPDPRSRPHDGAALVAALEGTGAKRSRLVGAVIFAVLASSLVLAWAGSRKSGRTTSAATSPSASSAVAPAQPMVRQLRRVTFGAGCESYPTFVDDGTLLFDSDGFREANHQAASEIVSFDLATGKRTRITHDPVSDYSSKASPDGKMFVYLHGDDQPVARLLPIAGDDAGPPLELGPAKAVAWAPDGAVVVSRPDGALIHVTLGSNPPVTREIARLTSGLFATSLVSFVDGRVFALWRRVNETPVLGELDPTGVTRILDDAVGTPTSDIGVGPSGALLYYGRITPAGSLELVQRSVDGGEPRPLPNGIAPRGGFTFSRNGDRLAYSTCNGSSVLMRLRTGEEPRSLLPHSDWDDYSPKRLDSRRILLSSTRSGNEQVWVVDVPTGAAKSIAGNGARSPAASLDGEKIVYAQAAHGLRIVSADGGASLTLTDDPTDNFPQFDRTGATVVFQRTTAAGKRIFAIPVAGGLARPIAPPGSAWPAPSPIADRIAYMVLDSDKPVRFVSLDGSDDVPARATFPRGNYRSLRLSPDGKRALLAHGSEIFEAEIESTSLATVRAKVESASMITSADYAPDGDGFAAAVERYAGDIWIAEGRFP